MVIELKFNPVITSAKFDTTSFDKEEMERVIDSIDNQEVELQLTMNGNGNDGNGDKRYIRIFTIEKDNCNFNNSDGNKDDANSDEFLINLFTDANSSTVQWEGAIDKTDCIYTDDELIDQIEDIKFVDITILPKPLHNKVKHNATTFKNGIGNQASTREFYRSDY